MVLTRKNPGYVAGLITCLISEKPTKRHYVVHNVPPPLSSFFGIEKGGENFKGVIQLR